jgi:hydroxymethylbilane synthase
MLTIGSRGSQLALWQSRWIAARLSELGISTKVEIIRTTGDKISEVALSKAGGKGLFTKELEDALLAGSIDLAVHSLKDLPTTIPAGLALTAVPERADPRDAMVGATLDSLPRGARVGTSSLRRAALLRHRRPDLRVEDIRGNLDTRLRKLDEGQFDAIMLAAAGLKRLGWGSRIAETMDPGRFCPAAGQGALAVETRSDAGDEALEICSKLDHAATRFAVTAERAVLEELGGGCQVPLGAHATASAGGDLTIEAMIVSPDGRSFIQRNAKVAAADAAAGGAALARELLSGGGAAILDRVYG